MPISEEIPEPNIRELKDYLKWHKDGWSLTDYARYNLTPDLAVAVAKLFWPEFVVHEGGVFYAEHFGKTISSGWKRKPGENLADVERLANHCHITDMIPALENFDEWDNVYYFGRVLTEIWRCALETRFPERRFKVVGERDEDEGDFIITFWQDE